MKHNWQDDWLDVIAWLKNLTGLPNTPIVVVFTRQNKHPCASLHINCQPTFSFSTWPPSSMLAAVVISGRQKIQLASLHPSSIQFVQLLQDPTPESARHRHASIESIDQSANTEMASSLSRLGLQPPSWKFSRGSVAPANVMPLSCSAPHPQCCPSPYPQ